MANAKDLVRLAAIADLHCTKTSQGTLQPLFSEMTKGADILLLCGDLTDSGQPDEARVLTKDLMAAVKIPVIAVLGNHDYDSGKPEEVHGILAEAGTTVLQGDACEVHGIGFAGAKGFLGGFGERALQPWGEDSVKVFVREAVDEALKLESALAKLRTPQRVALLHYSPIRTTVEGEPPEIFPFLGSSRLEEPLTRYPVAAVFHGHAHHGCPEGLSRDNVRVFNVSMPLLKRAFPDRPPFRIVEVPAAPGGGT